MIYKLLYIILAFSLQNCLSLTPPPITFTQSPTAAEKQMLGDNKEIEKDGWILSSIRTSATGSDVWEREILDSSENPDYKDEYFINLRTLSYFAPEIRDYKKKGFIGETLSGKLAVNPRLQESIFREEYPGLKARILEMLPIVNDSRAWIYARKIEKLSAQNLPEETLRKQKENVPKIYYKTISSGEFYESGPGKWSVKD